MHVCACVCACVHVCMWVGVCMCVHACACMHVCVLDKEGKRVIASPALVVAQTAMYLTGYNDLSDRFP